MPATTVPSATVPPAMAAAVLRPGATTSADINDLHVSLGHVHEGNLRESAKQMGIWVTGTLVPYSECAAAKGIRRSSSRFTARQATKPLELLYGNLSGAMPAFTGGSVYCFFIVDCYSNLGWPIFLKDKSAATVTHAFRSFLAAIKPLREKHGEPGALRTDNGTDFVNEPFANLLVQYGIRREFTSVDGPKRNGRVERRIALVKEGARAAWLGIPRLFPDVRFPSRAMHYSAVWPKTWTWMSENINITSRVDSPAMRCPEKKLYGKRLRKQLLPFLMPGHRTRGSGPKWAGKTDSCFYLNGGNDHASDYDKVMLESGIVSYTTNATYAYRRAPFVGQQVTFGNGVIRAPSPPPAATSMGGSGTGGLAGQSGESDAVTPPSPPPAASSAGRGDVGVLRGHPGRRGGIGGGTTLPPLSPVATPTEGDTSGLRSQSEEWRKSDRLDIPAQQDNPRSQSRRHTVTPAVTRSAARAQLGVGDQPGVLTVLSAKESISAAIATSAAPHSDSPELLTCPTCDLETPATHAQAHAGPHSKIWGAARAPASADRIAASAEAAEPATSDNVPSAASVGGAVGARESSAGAVPSNAATEAAPSTDDIAAPAASTAREARALVSAAGPDGEICGEREASPRPFDPGTVCSLVVHFYNGSWLQHGSSSDSSSSSSNDNTNDHDSWWDVTCVGALLRPFDPGKGCRRSTRRGKAVLGVDLPSDRGKAWGRMQHRG